MIKTFGKEVSDFNLYALSFVCVVMLLLATVPRAISYGMKEEVWATIGNWLLVFFIPPLLVLIAIVSRGKYLRWRKRHDTRMQEILELLRQIANKRSFP